MRQIRTGLKVGRNHDPKQTKRHQVKKKHLECDFCYWKCHALRTVTISTQTFPWTDARSTNDGVRKNKIKDGIVSENREHQAQCKIDLRIKILCLLWVIIAICLYFIYDELSYIGKTQMYAKVSCKFNNGNDLICRVNTQNMAPASVEDCGKNRSQFCGSLRQHLPSQTN